MANVYLEKIAAMAGNPVWEAGKAVGRVAWKGTKAIGNQIHLATGGGFRDHASQVLGTTDPFKIGKFGNSAKSIKALRNASIQRLGAGASRKQVKEGLRTFRKETIPQLKRNQTDARIAVGAMAGLTAYTGSKLKEQFGSQPQVQTYQY